MRRTICLLLLFLGCFVGTARGQTGVINLNVSSTPTNIVVNMPCVYVVVQENSSAPTNPFTITLPGSSVGITYAAGAKFIFTAGAGGYLNGQTIGSITIGSGTVSFVGIESISTPTVPAKGSGATGGSLPTAAGQILIGISAGVSAWENTTACTGLFSIDPTGNNPLNPYGPLPGPVCDPIGPFISVTPNSANPNVITPQDSQTAQLNFTPFPSQSQDSLRMFNTTTPNLALTCQVSGQCSWWFDANGGLHITGPLYTANGLPWQIPLTTNPCTSGSQEANAGVDLFYGDSANGNVLSTCDPSGVVSNYPTLTSTGVFTHKTLNCAVSSNVCDVNSLAMSTNVGNTTAVQRAGTVSGTGVLLCTDANQNTTTSGCPSLPFTPVTNSQSGLTIPGTSNQLITLTTPANTGHYTVKIIPVITTQPVTCTTYGTFNVHASWQDATTATTQTFDGPSLAIVAGSIVGSFANQGSVIPIYLTGGQPIQAGIKSTVAYNTCTTPAVIATQMEVTQ